MRELEVKYGADNSLIARTAKRLGWTRDLSIQVKQATDAKLIKSIAADVADNKSPSMDAAVVAVAAEINMNVILGHRTAARRALAAAQASVLCHAEHIADIREAAVFAGAVESLSRTAKNLVEIERKAFSFAEAPVEKPDADSSFKTNFASLRAKFDEVLGRTRSGEKRQ